MKFLIGFLKTAHTQAELKELIPEHVRVVKMLKSLPEKEARREAREQQKDLQEYKREAKK